MQTQAPSLYLFIFLKIEVKIKVVIIREVFGSNELFHASAVLLGVTNHTKNRDRFINSLVDEGYLERTIPDAPNSPRQKYVTRRKF